MFRHQPQNVTRDPKQVRVALIYRNFAARAGISHIGLGVAALLTQRTLQAMGYWAEVWPCNTAQDVRARLDAANAAAAVRGHHPVSHVVISAPWVPTLELQAMLAAYPDVDFAVVSHSNFGFLMADPNGIRLLRDAAELEAGNHNFTLGGNCTKFCDAWSAAYGVPCAYLPNLYDTSSIKPVGQRAPWTPGHTLRVGIFGATRPLKNLPSAVAAAIELAKTLKNDLEIWLSSGREESAGTVKNAIQQLAAGLPHVKLIEAGWRPWPAFRQLVGGMHLLMQPSYTESMNLVTADGIAEGVASVVSDAIDWVPSDWIANADNVGDIARTARRLLFDRCAVTDGQTALRKYVADGALAWERYLLRR
jgi:hypothetical protein